MAVVMIPMDTREKTGQERKHHALKPHIMAKPSNPRKKLTRNETHSSSKLLSKNSRREELLEFKKLKIIAYCEFIDGTRANYNGQ